MTPAQGTAREVDEIIEAELRGRAADGPNWLSYQAQGVVVESEMRRRILAALSAAGYAVVPKVPTVAMTLAGADEITHDPTNRMNREKSAIFVYRVMLQAAQEAK